MGVTNVGRMIKVAVLGVTVLLFTFLPAHAGVSLGQTRIVLPQASASQTVSLQNSGNEVYLVQAAVTDWETNKPSTQFSVLPPLFRFENNSTNALRVVRTGKGNGLPQDRESVFHFRINAIPAANGPKPEGGATVSISLGMGIKLFYRPEGLTITPVQAYQRVTFRRQSGGVVVSNPTPYYLTFSTLSLGGRTVNLQEVPMMLAPFSLNKYPAYGEGSRAEWTFITDYGSSSEPQSATIQ